MPVDDWPLPAPDELGECLDEAFEEYGLNVRYCEETYNIRNRCPFPDFDTTIGGGPSIQEIRQYQACVEAMQKRLNLCLNLASDLLEYMLSQCFGEPELSEESGNL